MVKDNVLMQYRTLEPMLRYKFDEQIVQTFILPICNTLPFPSYDVDADRGIVMPYTVTDSAHIVHKAIHLPCSVDGVVCPTAFFGEGRYAVVEVPSP